MGVTDATAPQATGDTVLILSSSKTGGMRLREIINGSTPDAVLPLNGGSDTAIRSLELNQRGGIHSQAAPPLPEFGPLRAKLLGNTCCSGSWVFVGDAR